MKKAYDINYVLLHNKVEYVNKFQTLTDSCVL